jgi:CPA2 family monovalent cation:H+ antiporter-2
LTIGAGDAKQGRPEEFRLPHDVSLIALIAVAFVLASICGYLADRLRLPALVGYLMAGVFMGPFTPGFVADASLAGQLAELGVILLMFGVGLHFSASDLLAVKGLAVPGAVGQIALATLAAVGLTSLWGWTTGEGIVFGLCISVASTVVLLKALEERNLLQTPTGRVAVGWLIVEDLAMVLALVLLPAFAEILGGHAAGGDGHGAAVDRPLWMALGITLAQVGAFVAVAALIGPRVVPWVLMKVARTGSRELFTLAVLGVALGIAFGSAAAFGVSFALGAFFAGVIMGESELSHRAAANSLPLQDAFSVLFFVSIGMLFDPSILLREPAKVFAVVALIIAGKGLIAFAIVVAMRYPIGLAFGISASLAQIGEFSFILAGLGMVHGLMSEQAQDLVLAGALLSILLNPLAFAAADGMRRGVQQRWPRLSAQFGLRRLKVLAVELERIKALAEKKHHEQEQRITRLVDDFPLFAGLDKHAQEELLLLFRPQSAAPGDRVIRKGDRGTAMYFLVSGAMEVAVGSRRVRLEPGMYFGEIALLTGMRRTADVTAVDYSELLVLDRREFNQFMARHPELRGAVEAMAEERRAMNRAEIAAG